jgi:hypothetical protein
MRSFLLFLLVLLSACQHLSACQKPLSELELEALPMEDQEVEIPATSLALEGSLALPARIAGEAVPAVVLIHGSGPQSRDSVLAGQLNMDFGGIEVSAFADISAALSAAGVAVLRYDKRSCTSAGGYCDNDYPTPGTDILVSDFATDALSAVSWLLEHEAVDPHRVFVVGHSQGAGLMPAILDGAPGLMGGVSLAGNYRPIDALLRYQLDFSAEGMLAAGYPQSAIDSQLSGLTEMVEALEALRAGDFSGSSIGGMPVGFWQDWLAIGDARPGLLALEQRPLLAINGDYDWNIPHDPELGLWEEAGAETVLLPCVTHALNCVEGAEIGTEVDLALLDALSDWILSH